jgi:AraC family transcriptional regulator of adaptative response / DNA-3-methyladenine glycosylase II
LRKVASRQSSTPRDEYRFSLRFRPPFCWEALLDFLAPRATPGVESVENGTYRRTFLLNGEPGWMEVALASSTTALDVRINYAQPRWLFLIIERVRAMFDLAADPDSFTRQLRRDPLLGSRIASKPGVRVPGCWDGFELAVRAVLGQQVTVRGATTLAGRLVREFGSRLDSAPGLSHLFPTPEKLAVADLSRIGIPRARASTLCSLARAVAEGKLSFFGVVDPEEFITNFRKIPGIGDWTAQYVAMRALSEPDAFPSSDLGLLRATGLPNPRELQARAEAWRPWRSYAAMYLWQVTAGQVKAGQLVPRKGVKHNAHPVYENRKPSRDAAIDLR